MMNSSLLSFPLLMHIDTLRLMTPFLLTNLQLAVVAVLATDRSQREALRDLQSMCMMYETPPPAPPIFDKPTREEFAFRFNLPLYGIQRIPEPIQRVVDRQGFHESYTVRAQFAELMEAAMDRKGINQNYNVFLLWAVCVLGVDPREHDRETVSLLGQQGILDEKPEDAVEAILDAIAAVEAGYQP